SQFIRKAFDENERAFQLLNLVSLPATSVSGFLPEQNSRAGQNDSEQCDYARESGGRIVRCNYPEGFAIWLLSIAVAVGLPIGLLISVVITWNENRRERRQRHGQQKSKH